MVGDLAYWTGGVSCRLFVCDGADLQVLQSSDLSLPAHGYVEKQHLFLIVPWQPVCHAVFLHNVVLVCCLFLKVCAASCGNNRLVIELYPAHYVNLRQGG